MLRRDELARWAATFGVADDQVRHDHMVSHILAGIAAIPGEGIVFYGGTALARTHLPHLRLSEDVDLLVTPRTEWAERLEAALPAALRRHVGPAQWDPPPTKAAPGAPARLVSGQLSVRVQLEALDPERSRWPVERRLVEIRYADVNPIELVVPTRAAFAAMKTLAWLDRHLARDLVDLAALANAGACDPAAAALVADMAGWRPLPEMFATIPASTRATWTVDLAHQMAAPPEPDTCLAEVRAAWKAAFS
jgi:hypothetical protein